MSRMIDRMFKPFRHGKNEPFTTANSANGTLIELSNVHKAYKTPAGDYLALKDINLKIDTGEFVAVQGKSGAGKSTLINMITGIGQPTKGEIRVGDHALHKMGEAKIAKWRGSHAGVIFQSFQLMPMLTCAQNVMLPMDFANLYRSPRERRRISSLTYHQTARRSSSARATGTGTSSRCRWTDRHCAACLPPVATSSPPRGSPVKTGSSTQPTGGG